MEEAKQQDVRYKCNNNTCDFENYIAGYCPMCDKGYLKKVCECQSGKYASDCCEPDLEKKEKEMAEKMSKELEKELNKEISESVENEKIKEEEEKKLFENDEEKD